MHPSGLWRDDSIAFHIRFILSCNTSFISTAGRLDEMSATWRLANCSQRWRSQGHFASTELRVKTATDVPQGSHGCVQTSWLHRHTTRGMSPVCIQLWHLYADLLPVLVLLTSHTVTFVSNNGLKKQFPKNQTNKNKKGICCFLLSYCRQFWYLLNTRNSISNISTITNHDSRKPSQTGAVVGSSDLLSRRWVPGEFSCVVIVMVFVCECYLLFQFEGFVLLLSFWSLTS